jgi:hypothetical protein
VAYSHRRPQYTHRQVYLKKVDMLLLEKFFTLAYNWFAYAMHNPYIVQDSSLLTSNSFPLYHIHQSSNFEGILSYGIEGT